LICQGTPNLAAAFDHTTIRVWSFQALQAPDPGYAAFTSLVQGHAGALFVWTDPFIDSRRAIPSDE